MADTKRPAGQPFTFSGVARYASARLPRLLGVALLFALLPAIILACLGFRCWRPVITEAVASLPERGSIERGTLQINSREARLLGANQFLSIQITVGENPAESAPVDLAIDLGRYELIAVSLFGEMAIPYPEWWSIRLDRALLVPFWGAWKGPLILAFSAAAMPGLIATWMLLALLYAPFALTIARLASKDLSFWNAWKMCVAAQWPASLLMSFALGLYATGEIGLLFVIIMFFAHFLPSILNVIIAPLFLPRIEEAEEKPARKKGGNPFNSRKAKAKRSKKNPFLASTPEED